MPTFEVTTPDGRVYEITEPEGVPGAVGEYQARRPTGVSALPPVAMPGYGGVTAFGRGAADMIEGVQQAGLALGEKMGLAQPGAAEEATQIAESQRRAYGAWEGSRSPYATGMRMTGGVLPYAIGPGGLAGGIGRRAVTSGLAGGAQGALSYVPPGGSRAQQAAVGAGVGALVPTLGIGVKRLAVDPLAKGARRIAPPIDTPPHLQQFDPTYSQITRDPTQWAVERNLAKLDPEGRELQARFYQQNQDLMGQGRGFVASRGVPEESVTAATRAQRVARAQDRLSQMPVSRKYSAARTGVGSETPMDTGVMKRGWAALKDEWENSLHPDIRKRVDSFLPQHRPFGVDESGEAIIRTIPPGREFTPNEINKTIQLINQHIDPKLPKAELAALRKTKGLLDDALADFEAADIAESARLWREARVSAKARFKKRGGGDTGPIAELVNPTTNMDAFIQQKVINGQLKNVRTMVSYFRDPGYRRGQEVLDGFARQVDEYLYAKGAGKARETFSGTNYADALQKIGDQKGRLIFGAEGWAGRKEFARASRDLTTTPAGAAVNFSNTAPTLFSHLDSAGFGRLPFVGRMLVQPWRRGARGSAQKAEITGALERRPMVWDERIQRWAQRFEPVGRTAIRGARAGSVPMAIELTRQ